MITRLAPLITNVTRENEALSEYRLHGENNYGLDRVTAASFQREMEYCRALWGAQKRFLETMDERLAEVFQPFSLHPYIAYASTSRPGLPAILTFAIIMIATWSASTYRARGMYGFGRSPFTCPTGSLILPSIS